MLRKLHAFVGKSLKTAKEQIKGGEQYENFGYKGNYPELPTTLWRKRSCEAWSDLR